MDKNLIEKRNALTTELRTMLDKWEAETKLPTYTFDAVAEGQWKERCNKIESDLDAVEAQIDRNAKRDALDARDNTPVFDSKGMSRGTVGDAKEDWGHRFVKALKEGDNATLRTMTVGASNNDIAAIPVNFDNMVREKLYQENVIRQIATVRTIDGQKRITIENALPTTELVAENAAMSSPSDPTFGSLIDVFPYKFQTKVVLTNEFLEDAIGSNGVGTILDYVAGKVATSMGRAHENYFLNGTNSSQPQGVGTTQFRDVLAALSPSQVISLAATSTALTAIDGDDIIDAYFAVQPQYRNNGSWVMSDGVLKTIRKIKTTSGSNEYIYKIDQTGDLREGVSGTLLGRPVYISAFYNTTSGAKKPYVTFGDFRFFEIFDRSGMNVLVDPYTSAGSAVTNMYAYSRLDSKVMHAEAFSMIACAAS